jgi:hypothetical protein
MKRRPHLTIQCFSFSDKITPYYTMGRWKNQPSDHRAEWRGETQKCGEKRLQKGEKLGIINNEIKSG